ncbi:GNAT family N-acetyltransferase [Salipiger mucosus]|uniref:GCN5-related protein N-acetyltransferase n=1 Tax=Salipiger mucosus DSM 16094 TaxID=1123237 RepID=S9S033_9RHOB|nr:GNAT family N-acetyltransferase [Salipiger mucosus]EPX79574.1 GCN5-related protein N-acetyltransferase [Salipiger mucosus DSM 16094]
MALAIAPISPRDPHATALLRASHALMESLFPPEENHFLDIDALCDPSVTLYGAREDDVLLGCAALARAEGYAEVKSMYVAPEARGIGVARRLLMHLERVAAEDGIPLLRLETGDRLGAAVSLYEREGFLRRGPFGNYQANGSSLFYEKPVQQAVAQ